MARDQLQGYSPDPRRREHQARAATDDGPPRDALTDACVRHAASRSAERGWYVFPTRPGGKEPRPGLSWPDAATCDPSRLATARWRPGEGYGVAAKLSGLVILDLDQPKPDYVLPPRWKSWADEPGITDGWDVLATLAGRHADCMMPWTFTVRTPSGGAHLYYTAPCDRNIGNKPLGPMIDVRGGGDGNGGYALGPGSVLNGRRYEVVDDQDPQPLPAWIADLLDPPVRPAQGHQVPQGSGSTFGRLRGILGHVLDGQQGDRNGRLYWAACRASELVSEGLIDRTEAEQALVTAALASGLRGGEHEARKTIASGFGAIAA